MEKFLTLMEYYWISNGTLPKILLVFWVIAVISFYAVVHLWYIKFIVQLF
jgi:hypothetical protein